MTCECNPKQRALRCYSCTQREKKLWSKKLEKSGTKASSGEADTTEMSEEADQERIIVFHCLPCVEIINNEALLRARITCYCRHHDEKTGFRCVGFFFFFLDQYFKRWISCKPRPFLVAFPKPFRIHFRLKNEKNEVIAQGRSPPIMITDDHKPSRKLKHAREANDDDDLSDVDDRDSDSSPPPKKKANTKRPPSRGGQVETGVSTPQPVPSPPLLPTPQHPLPHLQQQQFQAQQTLLLHQQQQQQQHQQRQQHLPVTPATIPSFLHAHNSFLFPYPTAHSPLPGPVNIKTPPSTPYLLGNQLTADAQLLAKFAQSQPSSQPLPPLALPLVTSPTHIPVSDGLPGRHPAMVGLPLLHSNNPNTLSPRSWDRENGDVTRHHPSEPKINKVIPAEGRLEGKTEVIVLGNGFYGTFLCLPFFLLPSTHSVPLGQMESRVTLEIRRLLPRSAGPLGPFCVSHHPPKGDKPRGCHSFWVPRQGTGGNSPSTVKFCIPISTRVWPRKQWISWPRSLRRTPKPAKTWQSRSLLRTRQSASFLTITRGPSPFVTL